MKKFKTEIVSFISAIILAYFWQLFAIFMCYITDMDGNFVTREMFIPAINIQIVAVPMITWVLMGFLKVSWFKKWLQITVRGFAFVTPFMLIAGVTVLVNPSLWREAMFWLANVALSILLAFTLFKPLLKYRYGKVCQN